MRMTKLLAAALVAAPIVATPVAFAQQASGADQDDTITKARHAKMAEALKIIKSDPAGAIALLDPVIADYEADYAQAPQLVFCAESPTETIAYMALGSAAKPPRDAIAVDFGWCSAYWAKGFALVELKQFDAARISLEKAVARAPLHAHYLSELGYVHQQLKQYDKSLEYFQRAEAGAELTDEKFRDRELNRAWFGQAYALIELGRLDEAEALLGKGAKRWPTEDKWRSELKFAQDLRKKGS